MVTKTCFLLSVSYVFFTTWIQEAGGYHDGSWGAAGVFGISVILISQGSFQGWCLCWSPKGARNQSGDVRSDRALLAAGIACAKSQRQEGMTDWRKCTISNSLPPLRQLGWSKLKAYSRILHSFWVLEEPRGAGNDGGLGRGICMEFYARTPSGPFSVSSGH